MEYPRLRENQILFTYLHLAPMPELTEQLVENKVTAIAYETVTGRDGRSLPLLSPMSEVAGRMSVQVGAYYLQKPNGGRGVLPGGVPGVSACLVVTVRKGRGFYSSTCTEARLASSTPARASDTIADWLSCMKCRFPISSVKRAVEQDSARPNSHVEQACPSRQSGESSRVLALHRPIWSNVSFVQQVWRSPSHSQNRTPAPTRCSSEHCV